MNYTEIKTSQKMNEVVKEQLIFRGDHLSKYAAKRIEELEQLLLCGVVKSLPTCYLTELDKIQQLGQNQESTRHQIEVLRAFANKLGLYDAADYLRQK